MIAAAGALLLPPVSLVALGLVERVDWAFVGQRFIVVSVWALTFGFALRATRDVVRHRAFSPWRALVPPVAVLVVLLVMPRAASTLATWRGDGRFEPTVAFERHAAADVAFQLVSNLFVARKGFDAEYYRFLHTESNFSGAASVTVPVIDLAASRTPSRRRRPDIFVIALDSLRRDYLSPYNAAVSFTPAIGSLAADGFVFENAFTRHGGTELAIPSIWAGGMLVRQVRVRGFERVNAFEKLVNTEGYRILINDFTIAQNILPSTPVTRLNPGVPSADTDLCGNLEALQSELDAAGPDDPPVFGYLSPMNVHILNTQRNGQRSLDGDYPGFFAPYASRLRRIDTCLGQFVSYLEQTNRYDESIIVITSDHGDSLGENGHWGHATWLPPEVVRIPLIVKIPASARSTLTTDLARLAFSTDIAPTLYALLGHPVRDLGPLFGAPLFVPTGDDLRDRRRGSFLLTASYGATYGLVRRNGRSLYVTDLVERREFAYDLSRGVVGAETTVDHGLRQVNQREIRGQVAEIARFFKVTR
jgi:membrane-anchored protein YejM (alkaline phosphatase superfamily)